MNEISRNVLTEQHRFTHLKLLTYKTKAKHEFLINERLFPIIT